VEWLKRRLEGYRGTLAMISHDRYLLESPATSPGSGGGAGDPLSGAYSWYAPREGKRREVSLARQANEDRKRAQIERYVGAVPGQGQSGPPRSRARSRGWRKWSARKWRRWRGGGGASGWRRRRMAARRCCGARGGFAYDEGRWIFRGVDLSVRKGEKLAVVGPTGRGRRRCCG
jgi:ATPase subunit of ABC transporter with duplicated ATPase domains